MSVREVYYYPNTVLHVAFYILVVVVRVYCQDHDGAKIFKFKLIINFKFRLPGPGARAS